MKRSSPYLSALVLAALAAAAIAERPTARGPRDVRIAMARGGSDPADDEGETAAYTSPPHVKAQAEEDEGLPVGERLVREAVRRLEEPDSITARVRHEVSIDGRRHYGSGSYWQQGHGDDLETRLELQIAGQEASLLQTSNGRFLWTDRRLPTGRVVTCVELHKLRADLDLRDIDEGVANDDWSGQYSEDLPARAPDFLLVAVSGGLRGLLASLGENFDFLPPQAMRLSITPLAGSQSVDLPVFAVVGRWKPERAAALLADGASQQSASKGQPAEKKEAAQPLSAGSITALRPVRLAPLSDRISRVGNAHGGSEGSVRYLPTECQSTGCMGTDGRATQRPDRSRPFRLQATGRTLDVPDDRGSRPASQRAAAEAGGTCAAAGDAVGWVRGSEGPRAVCRTDSTARRVPVRRTGRRGCHRWTSQLLDSLSVIRLTDGQGRRSY